MDQDYLQNISASPYVEEGVFDRALARGMSGAQRFSAMTGGSMTDLNYTKIKSLFSTFQNRVTTILKDFNDVSTRLEQMQPRPSTEQIVVINKLRELYSVIVPTPFQQHQYGQMTPKNSSRPGGLTGMVEGFFNRDLALNKALQTNKPTEIINAYITQLKKAYDSFVNDAVKVTNAPKDYVARVVGGMDPKYGKILGAVKKVVETPMTAAPGAVPPKISGTADSTTTAPSTTSAVPPPLPGSNGDASKANGGNPTPTGALKNAANLGGNGNDFAIIVGHVIDVITSAVAEDAARSEPYFTQKLPTTWDEPSLHAKPPARPKAPPGPSKPKSPTPAPTPAADDYSIEEADVEGDELPDGNEPESDASQDFQDEPGQFLYNFAGRYDKAKNFAIELPIKGMEKIKLSKGRVKNIRVIWVNKTHENEIHVKYQDAADSNGENAKQWKEILLFKFFDSSADPRSPTFVGNKSIYQYLHDANPYETNLLKGADKAVLQDLESKTDKFNRALYAVVHRKAMEFKGRPKGNLDMVANDDGSVSVYNNPNYKESPYDKEKIKNFVNSTDEKEKILWKNSLEHIGYFDKYPDMKPTVSPNIQDATEILMTGGISKVDAEDLVQKAIDEIGPSAISMDGEELSNYVLEKLGKDTHKVKNIPAAVDAVLALKALGYKESVARDAIQKVIDSKGAGLSKEEYIKAALATPKPGAPSPAPSPASAPVATEPPGSGAATVSTPSPAGDTDATSPTAPSPSNKPPTIGSAKEEVIDGKNYVMYTKEEGMDPLQLSLKQVVYRLANPKQEWKFIEAMKKSGLFDKYAEIAKRAAAKSKTKPKDPGSVSEAYTPNGFVNPFQRTNLL